MAMTHRSRSMIAGPRTAGLLIVASLGACAPAVVTEPVPGPVAESGNDCAVIAAVAREHYRFNAMDNVPPPLWLDGEGSGWAPRCDLSRYGVAFPRLHDPDRTPAAGERVQWVRFRQPRYDGQGALIEAGVLHGPLAGMGVGAVSGQGLRAGRSASAARPGCRRRGFATRLGAKGRE